MDISIPDWLLGLSALLTLVYLYGTWHHKFFDHLHIPYVKPWPIVGNMGPMIMRQLSGGDLVRDIYNAFPTAKLMGFFNMNSPVLFVRDPDIIKTITVKDFEYFTDHKAIITEDGDALMGKNLFSMKGDRWKDMRHTLSPAFTSSKMKAMFLLVDECGQQMGTHLEKKCKASSDGIYTLEMKDFYTRYTNDVIATSAFGVHCDSLENPDNEFYTMGKDATNFDGIRTLIFFLYSLFPKLMQAFNITLVSKHVAKFFGSLVHDTIAHRKKEGIVRPDMIHLLMEARKDALNSDNSGEPNKGKKLVMSDDDVTAQAFIFFVAGFDTASTLLCFMTHLLATHPEIQQRLQEDIDQVMEEDGGKVTYEGAQKLKYLDMIISETLRLWPPAIAGDRQCVKPYTLQATDTTPEIKMNVGDYVWFPIIGLHRDPKYFPDPDSFDPERFSDENKHRINSSAYMPFGAGPRICIGMRFAQMEAKIAMMHLLSRFDLQVVEKTQKNLRLDAKGINMKVVGGFWLGIKPRTSRTTK